MGIWKDFCRSLEHKKVQKHIGNLVPEINLHSLFEFTKEQSDLSKECNPADFAEDEDHPLPPFPFPKVCIVHHDGVIALREPYMDEETGILEFDMVTWVRGENDAPGTWALSVGSVSVDTTAKDEEGRFKWEVYDMAGVMSHSNGIYTFDEDTPLRMGNEEDLLEEPHSNLPQIERDLRAKQAEIEASGDPTKLRELEEAWASFEGLKETQREYEAKRQELINQLDSHAKEINRMTMSNLRQHFYLGLQNIAWINHPDHYTVELNPEQRRRKLPKGRVKRLTDRERYILLTKSEITEEWHRIHKGGSHASPVPHLRRGHYKTLRAERYKEKRGKRIWVRATHVNGQCVEWRDGNIIYKVI